MSLPPRIGDFSAALPASLAARCDAAMAAIGRLDAAHGKHLASLSALLLRAESVASSKIERVEASVEDFARAAHGTRSNASAISMVASTRALTVLIDATGGSGRSIALGDILEAHRILMADDPDERPYAGALRDDQNWIGGSDHSPRGALYVPPPAETVEGYLADLLELANRDDVPVLAQAAVVHAQFESIHPFGDGNGRIGRALVNAILRRRGATTSVVVPVATALVAKREAYFDLLTAYRRGDAGPIIVAFALAATSAARESATTGRRLADLPAAWRERHRAATGRYPRAGSATSRVLERLLDDPFFSVEEMERAIGSSGSSTSDAVRRLAGLGILRGLTSRTRNQVWCAGDIIDELEDLGVRVASATAADPVWRRLQAEVVAGLLRHEGEESGRGPRPTRLPEAVSRVVDGTPPEGRVDQNKNVF
ncbi:Fic family protein [Nocardioides convexus]|uniref:Fic family protein n=1 Tax=Nocardioides convexus TaxID=2712224 RepID=UPI00241856CF|nr:Fic family protein [Nocardioides convexus]